VILLYHAIDGGDTPLHLPAEAFETHLKWLNAYCRIVPIEELLAGRAAVGKPRIALTFDDGLLNHLKVVLPLLEQYNAPATFFVPSGPLDDGALLWFNYLSVLCFCGEYQEISVDGVQYSFRTRKAQQAGRQRLGDLGWQQADPVEWAKKIEQRYPVQHGDTWSLFRTVTTGELNRLAASPLVEIGAHTVTHPFLPRCGDDRLRNELTGCRSRLEELLQRKVRYMAYPAGQYDARVANEAKASGYEAAFTTARKREACDKQFEIERIGIYSPSRFKLTAKIFGIGTAMRRMGMKVG
jgi:peptidoglycan/xylan/chitin deacetylase (PgdA/CDA1 family)